MKDAVNWVEVGRRLRQIRKEKRLSQREFGRLFGVSQNMISLYEKGKSKASVDFYVRAALLGGRTIEWLLEGSDDRACEALRQMNVLYERIKADLASLKGLLERETERAREQRIAAIEDPERLRSIVVHEKDLPASVRRLAEDVDLWRDLAMTGRELCAFCRLINEFGEMKPGQVRRFLELVREAKRPFGIEERRRRRPFLFRPPGESASAPEPG